MDCHPASSLTCQDLAQSFEQWHGGATIAFPLQLLPALIGAFAGAPILAREMETGTFRYAWTQGFGRTRWIIAKLALVGGPLAVIAGAFGILTYWYFGPFVAEGQLIPLDPRTFDLECLRSPAGCWPPSRSAPSLACSSAGSSRDGHGDDGRRRPRPRGRPVPAPALPAAAGYR